MYKCFRGLYRPCKIQSSEIGKAYMSLGENGVPAVTRKSAINFIKEYNSSAGILLEFLRHYRIDCIN